LVHSPPGLRADPCDRRRSWPPLASCCGPARCTWAQSVTATRSAISHSPRAPTAESLASSYAAPTRYRSRMRWTSSQVSTLSTARGRQPIIRGLTGPRVLVLDNGQRLEDTRGATRTALPRTPGWPRSWRPGERAYRSTNRRSDQRDPQEVARRPRRAPFMRGAAELWRDQQHRSGTSSRPRSGAVRLDVTGSGVARTTFIRRPATIHADGRIYNTGITPSTGSEAACMVTRVGPPPVHGMEPFGLLMAPSPADTPRPVAPACRTKAAAHEQHVLGGVRLETKSQWQPPLAQEYPTKAATAISQHRTSSPAGTRTRQTSCAPLFAPRTDRDRSEFPACTRTMTRGVSRSSPGPRTSAGRCSRRDGHAGPLDTVGRARGDPPLERRTPMPHCSFGATRNASALTANLGVVYRAAPGLASRPTPAAPFARRPVELFTNGPTWGRPLRVGLPDARPR